MELSAHPYGRPYYHIPTDRVIFLSGRYAEGTYYGHYQYRESIEVIKSEDLRHPLMDEVLKHYPKYYGN